MSSYCQMQAKEKKKSLSLKIIFLGLKRPKTENSLHLMPQLKFKLIYNILNRKPLTPNVKMDSSVKINSTQRIRNH